MVGRGFGIMEIPRISNYSAIQGEGEALLVLDCCNVYILEGASWVSPLGY